MKVIVSIECEARMAMEERGAQRTGVVMCLKYNLNQRIAHSTFYFNVDLMNFSWDLVHIQEQPIHIRIRCVYK